MADYIEPRVLKGFRDFLPSSEIARRDILESLEKSFRAYGFVPIDTPVLEYADILLGKGGGETEKQIYRFNDNGGRDVAMRFDLTVPFARFMAQHREELYLPFKRYHIAKVWRGENTQRGRYREFIQCDFDIVGSHSAASDFEILLVMKNSLEMVSQDKEKCSITIRYNHRGLFNRFLSRLEVMDKSVEILRTVDKLSKIGRQETENLLREQIGDKAKAVLDYIEASGSFEEKLKTLNKAATGSDSENCPEAECLYLIHQFMLDTGTEKTFVLDPAITRGLDYYTGIVFESFLNDLPEIGSVCSGGRYDNLVGLYTKPNSGEAVGGVGTSIGIDRLIAALETLGKLNTKSSYADIAIACLKEKDSGLCQALAERFRAKGMACEVFLDEAKLQKQYVLAEKKGLSWLIIPDEENANNYTLRNLKTRENQSMSEEKLLGFFK